MSNRPVCLHALTAARAHPFLLLCGALLILGLGVLMGCAPSPVRVATPTLTPSAVIAPTASAAPVTVTPPTLSSPPPTISYAERPSAISHPPSATSNNLPVIVTEVDLGVNFEYLSRHTVALDPDGKRLFIGVAPTQTLVLSTDNWRAMDPLPVGGDVAMDRQRKRLYVGAPDGVTMFDLDSLQPIGNIPIVAPPYGGTPLVDENAGTVFVIHNGLYAAHPATPNSTERISGTFPSANDPAYAVDAALEADRRLMYISLNNGIPGSNNGNILLIYNYRSGEVIYRDDERSIMSLVTDEGAGRAFVARSRLNAQSVMALTVEQDTVKPLWRLNGIAGSLQVDPQRGRVYIADAQRPHPRLIALDAATGAWLSDVPLPRAYTLVALDAKADQLYLLSRDGRLLVMSGHGAPAPTTASSALLPSTALTGTVVWIAPSPDLANDRTLFAALEPISYSRGLLDGYAGQLMISTDGGSMWSGVAGGLPQHLLVNALAFSPDFARDRTLFAALITPGNLGGGLYVSHDAGHSWRPTMRGLGDAVIVEVVVAPGFPVNQTVFALTRSSGLFRSTDGGATWQRTSYRPDPPVALAARTLAVSPNYVNDHTLIVSTGNTTSISRDGGENWWPVIHDRATHLAYASENVLMGSFASAAVMRSDDGGATWQATSRGLRLNPTATLGEIAIWTDPEQAPSPLSVTALALIYWSDQTSTLYRTMDGGANWQIEISGWPGQAQISTVAFASNGTLFVGTDKGQVRQVRLDELIWSNAPVALDKMSVEAISLSPGYARDRTLFIGNGGMGVFVSTDGGKTWAESNLPARDLSGNRLLLAVSPEYANDQTVFASAGGQAFRSNDGGANWIALTDGLGNFMPASALAVSPQFASDRTVLVGSRTRPPRLMRSTDGGETWSVAVGLPPTGQASVGAIAFAPGNGQVAYTWIDQAGLFRSGDGGATWTRLYSPTAGVDWESLGISPNFLRDRLMFASGPRPQTFLRSADGGASWHPSDSGLPSGLFWAGALAISPDFPRDRVIFLGTDRGVFRSEDGGLTWRLAGVGLPQVNVLALALSPDFASDRMIFAGLADRGLYVSTDGGQSWKPAK